MPFPKTVFSSFHEKDKALITDIQLTDVSTTCFDSLCRSPLQSQSSYSETSVTTNSSPSQYYTSPNDQPSFAGSRCLVQTVTVIFLFFLPLPVSFLCCYLVLNIAASVMPSSCSCRCYRWLFSHISRVPMCLPILGLSLRRYNLGYLYNSSS